MSSKIAIVGEAWGENEDRLKRPLVGVSGVELLRMGDEAGLWTLTDYDRDMIKQFWFTREPHYLALVWDKHPEVFLTNVFNLRPANNDIETLCEGKADNRSGLPSLRTGKYVRAEFLPHVERLRREINGLRPHLVVLLGNTATWAVLQDSGISKIRGAITVSKAPPGFKVLPTYHPAAVLRDWSLRPVTILDLAKAKRESAFPDIRRPKRIVYIEPQLPDMEWFYAEHLVNAKRITLDIESLGDQITCIGFSPNKKISLVIPFVDPRRPTGSYWPTADDECAAWRWVNRVLQLPAPKTAQNGLYDIHFLWRNYGITVRNFEHDTMLLHHSLQPESPKALGFLGSVYTNEASWKMMRTRGKTTIKRDE